MAHLNGKLWQAPRAASPSRSHRRPFPASARPAASLSCSKTAPAKTSSFSRQEPEQRSWPRRGSGPRSPACTTTFCQRVPQVFVDVDRDKVAQAGRARSSDVYQTLQAFMGGAFVNYFNRFGRQWQVYVQAEGDYRTNAENLGHFYVRNSKGDRCRLSALTKIERRPGPEFIDALQRVQRRADQCPAGPGYSSGQAMKALEEVFDETMPREMGYDYMGMSFQDQMAAERRAARGHLRALAAVRLPDPGGAVRELDAALQRAAEHADRGLRRLGGALPAALREPRLRERIFMPRSDWSC